MKSINFLTYCLGLIILVGCQSGDGFSPQTPNVLSSPSKGDAKATDEKIAAWVTQYYASTQPSEQQQLRNDIMDAVMGIIDNRYLAFDEDLWKNRNLSDFAFDMTNIALGFTGTIVGGTETKTVTNALVTVITGTKTGVSTDFYNQQTALAISAKMKALRSGQSVVILNHRSDGVDTYPLAPDALEDLATYYRDGTVLGALQDITATSGADSKDNSNIKTLVQSAGNPTTTTPTTQTTTSPAQLTQPSVGGSPNTATNSSVRNLLIMRDSTGKLHLYNRNLQAEIKFDASGIPIEPTGSTPPTTPAPH